MSKSDSGFGVANEENDEPNLEIEAFDTQDLEQWIKPEAPKRVRNLILSTLLPERVRISSSNSAPLPPSEEFRKYNEVEPTAANRILKMAEKSLELAGEEYKVARRRINASTMIALGMIGLTAYGIFSVLPGSVIVPLGLSGIFGLFIREIMGFLSNR